MKRKSCTAATTAWPSSVALAHQHRVVQLGVGLGGLQPLGVPAPVAELERVLRHLRHRHLDVFAVVEEVLEPLLRGHAHVVVGARDDELVGLQVLVVDHLPGVGAFDPHVLRHLALGRRQQAADFRADEVADPVHAERSIAPFPDPHPERTTPTFAGELPGPWAICPCFSRRAMPATSFSPDLGPQGAVFPVDSPFGPKAVTYRLDQRRAHHHAVGPGGYGLGLLRRPDAETDRHRQLRRFLDPGDVGVNGAPPRAPPRR